MLEKYPALLTVLDIDFNDLLNAESCCTLTVN